MTNVQIHFTENMFETLNNKTRSHDDRILHKQLHVKAAEKLIHLPACLFILNLFCFYFYLQLRLFTEN